MAHFTLAVLAALLVGWTASLRSLRFPTLFLSLDPDRPQRETLCAALHAGILSAQRHPMPILVRLSTPAGPRAIRFTLCMNNQGELFLQQDGMRKMRLPFQNQWIPDHPLPFHFSPTEATVLQMTGTTSGRVRVGLFPDEGRRGSPLLLSLLFLVTLGSFMLGIEWLSALAGGLGIQSALMQYRLQRTP